MASNLWTPNTVPSTIFHWKDLLEIWNTTYTRPYPIDTVIANLDRVREVGLTCIQFKRYLNFMEEDEGLKWILYECIMRKPSWPSLDFCIFLRGITDDVSLDTGFPDFPGSPRGMTARSFINTHMSALEIDFLDMMPPLVRIDYDPSPPVAERKYATCQIRIIRKVDTDNPQDDIINIYKKGESEYGMSYIDPTTSGYSGKKMVLSGLNKDTILTRLSQTFRVMGLDSEPFESIQLLLPSYPCVLLPVNKLDSYTRDLIYDMVESTMQKWPIVA